MIHIFHHWDEWKIDEIIKYRIVDAHGDSVGRKKTITQVRICLICGKKQYKVDKIFY